MELPDDRPVVADDIRALRISAAVRGYRMTEVDWLLDQFAQTLDERDEEIAALRAAHRRARRRVRTRRRPATADADRRGDARRAPTTGEEGRPRCLS